MTKRWPQTKKIVAALKAAGFKRSEFRCRKRLQPKKRVEVTLLCDVERSVQLTDAIVAQGLNVRHCIVNGEVEQVIVYIPTSNGVKGKFEEIYVQQNSFLCPTCFGHGCELCQDSGLTMENETIS